VTYPSRNIFKALLPAAVALVVVLGVAGPAAAKSSPPCWKTLINDWYDGRIDGTYAIHCYRDALTHLPADVDTYSSARDDIKQALQERITQSHTTTTAGPKKGETTTTGAAGGGGSSGGSSGSSGGASGGSGGGSTGGDKSTAGPIGQVFSVGKPSKADSVPVPLIVLGGVALLLMAAGGAGFLTRRMRTRKLQLASAATLPHRSGPAPPDQP
jgi:hypothetical protein